MPEKPQKPAKPKEEAKRFELPPTEQVVKYSGVLAGVECVKRIPLLAADLARVGELQGMIGDLQPDALQLAWKALVERDGEKLGIRTQLLTTAMPYEPTFEVVTLNDPDWKERKPVGRAAPPSRRVYYSDALAAYVNKLRSRQPTKGHRQTHHSDFETLLGLGTVFAELAQQLDLGKHWETNPNTKSDVQREPHAFVRGFRLAAPKERKSALGKLISRLEPAGGHVIALYLDAEGIADQKPARDGLFAELDHYVKEQNGKSKEKYELLVIR